MRAETVEAIRRLANPGEFFESERVITQHWGEIVAPDAPELLAIHSPAFGAKPPAA
jgi:hypothetical protein